MPFFPQAYLSPEAGLFQILSELDQPQQETCVRRQSPRAFTPGFDVTEVAQAYELFGEVPGLEQQHLSIEFADAQTLIVKGKTERGASTTQAIEATQPESTETSSEKSHSATVEDAEYDEADTPLATPASTATATETQAEEQKQAETPKPKYWVAERRVGTFERSFSFSQRIEQDAVQASLKNGILHVVVPKSQKSKKVAVSVN